MAKKPDPNELLGQLRDLLYDLREAGAEGLAWDLALGVLRGPDPREQIESLARTAEGKEALAEYAAGPVKMALERAGIALAAPAKDVLLGKKGAREAQHLAAWPCLMCGQALFPSPPEPVRRRPIHRIVTCSRCGAQTEVRVSSR